MKKPFFFTAIFFLAVFLLGGCFRPEFTTITISVPGMKDPACGKVIIDNLSRVDGIKQVEPDLQAHTVMVTYKNTKLAKRNIQYVIAGLGFDADDVQGDPQARAKLPAACR